MALQLQRLEDRLCEAERQLSVSATADELFALIAPTLIETYGIRRVTLTTERGLQSVRLSDDVAHALPIATSIENDEAPVEPECSRMYPIVVDDVYKGTLYVEADATVFTPTLDLSVRHTCALFALAFASAEETAEQAEVAEKPLSEIPASHALFDNHPAPLLVYDAKTRQVLAANAAFRETYGYTEEELLSVNFDEIDSEEPSVLTNFALGKMRARHRRHDGSRIDVEVTTQNCQWGNTEAYVALINDISSRTRIERRLVESEKRLERVQEIGGVGIFEIDLRSGKRYYSSELYRQFGIADEQELSLDRTLNLDYIHPEDRDTVQSAYDSAIERHDTYRVDHRILRPDGTVVWVQCQGEFDFEENGEAIRLTGTTVDITERKTAESQLGFLAHFDPLTGLANRAHIVNELQQALKSAKRHETSLAVLFMDLDRFKQINDTMGHDAGDRLLVEVSRRLKKAVRETDCVARLGGDEFVALLQEAGSTQSAEQVAQRIATVLSRPYRLHGRTVYVTCSIGISHFPNDGPDVDTLLSHADMAMYEAKRAGRNKYCVYRDEMLQTALERMAIEADLRRAIERDEFFLEYQPIFSISDRRLMSAEALIRWRHPEGLRSPAEFIAIAEESDIMLAIGDWVLRTACAQAVAWKEHNPNLCMSVNVSSRQIMQENFVQDVLAVLQETGMDPRRLQLELTETALVTDFEKTQRALFQLREAGVRIAIDDFGTGYNSLANLRHPLIDSLKIDRSFISGINNSPNDLAIAGAVVSAGRSLGIRVVAEGVETDDHYTMLRHLGCDDGQGFWFSEPVGSDVFYERFLVQPALKVVA